MEEAKPEATGAILLADGESLVMNDVNREKKKAKKWRDIDS